MKRIVLSLISCFLLLTFLSCTSMKKEEEKIEVSKIQIPSNVKLSSTGLLKVDNSEVDTFNGLLEKSDNEDFNFVINDNYKSRSKVSYYISEKDSDKKALDELSKRVGEEVKVKGWIKEDIGIWTKIISISEVY